MNLENRHFYGIFDLGYADPKHAIETVNAMLDGGVQILQIRAKNQSENHVIELAEKIHPVCEQYNVPLILNDHPELLQKAPAEGAHVGQDDVDVAEARRLAGRPVLIGKSTHSLGQVEAAMTENPDYIGFGPLFATPTKPTYIPVGLDSLPRVYELATCPVFCIGGIHEHTLQQVLDAGAQRIVMVSGILKAASVKIYCKQISNRLRNHR